MHLRATKVLLAALPTLASLILTTCDVTDGTYDQTWVVRYRVSNQSSVDVTVRDGSYFLTSYKAPLAVPAGKTAELAYYEEFLGSPPDAGRVFTCVSVYRDSDSLLVFQIAPVKNSQWKRHELQKYREEYTLELTNAKLSVDGLKSRCGEITGSVVDSVTVSPLTSYHVAVREDMQQEPFMMQTNTGPSNEYTLMWYGDLPDGTIYFGKAGYRCRTLRLPASADSLGNGRYVLNIDLPPFPLPEDSLRYGQCF